MKKCEWTYLIMQQCFCNNEYDTMLRCRNRGGHGPSNQMHNHLCNTQNYDYLIMT